MRVGIDLGTTNSAIAYIDDNGIAQVIPNREGNRTTPSVILFDDGIAVVGETAKHESVSNPQNTAQFVKKYIGRENSYVFEEKDISAEELSALILKKLKEDAEEYLGEKITGAVVTVPADFNDNERKATIDACNIAGLNLIKIINEPTAAALAYGCNSISKEENIVVYDLGGGTFDATVMNLKDGEVNIKSSLGDKSIGGFDFENKIIELVINEFEKVCNKKLYADKIAMQDLRQKAEQCKKILSSRSKTRISISSRGYSVEVEITQEQFNSMISSLIDKTMRIMNYAVKQAGLTWNEIDKILLVGGSTRIKKVSEEIERLTGIKPSREVNPDEAVALGAAVQANIDNIKHKIKVSDVSAHSLGILVSSFKDGIKVDKNHIIIEKNTTLPCEKGIMLKTAVDNQTSYKLVLTEGESKDLEFVKIIGTADIQLNKRPKGSPIKIKLNYDDNSVVSVSVIDDTDDSLLNKVKINRLLNLTEDEVSSKQRLIDNIDIEG